MGKTKLPEATLPEVPETSSATETDALLTPKDIEKQPLLAGDTDRSPGLFGLVSDLRRHYGYKHMCLLFVSQFLNKSMAHHMVGVAVPYLYKAYRVPAPEMQIYSGITGLPWVMKPMFGLTSDLFPIMGFNKTPYMLITNIMGIIALVSVGTSSLTSLHIGVLVGCLFLIQLYVAFADLLTESKFAQKMREHPKRGPSLMSFVWGGMLATTIISQGINAYVLENKGPNLLFLIAVIPACVLLLPSLFNFMEERPVSSLQAARIRAKFWQKDKEVSVLCLVMFIGVVILLVIDTAFTGPDRVVIGAIASIVVAAVTIVGFGVLLSPAIAKFNTFSLLQTSLGWSHSAAAFYFYTDNAEQFPEGPHFDPMFFNGWMGLFGTCVSLLGIYTYHRWFSDWPYRRLLLCTQMALATLSILDMIMFTRYNVVLGIPDRMMILGMSASSQLLWQWEWMPQVVIFSQLCPKGMEATMYALLAGAHNLGGTVAGNCGALLLQWLDVTPDGSPNESHKFDNLWKTCLIGTGMPLITIMLLFTLIPDVRQTEKILDDTQTATQGSLWRRLVYGEESD